jgi:hypothetical protein
MKSAATARVQEPVGIVIAVRPAVEEPTVFSAYVWGPAPGTEDTPPRTS